MTVTRDEKFLLKAKKVMLKQKIEQLKKEYVDLCNHIKMIHKSQQNPVVYLNIMKANSKKRASKPKVKHDGQEKQS